jgi:hypothetical protein
LIDSFRNPVGRFARASLANLSIDRCRRMEKKRR